MRTLDKKDLCLRLLFVSLLIAGACRAGIELWAQRNFINPDVIGYMQVGRGWVTEGYTALSAYWHPLYSVIAYLFAGALPVNEAVAGHLLNAVFFGIGWILFHSFARTAAAHFALGARPREWMLLAHSIFLCTNLELGQLWLITPDFFVASWVYLSSILVLRTRQNATSLPLWICLGTVLGAGYWTKTVMLHYGAFLLGSLSLWNWRGPGRRGLCLAATVFAIIVGAHVLLVAAAKGEPSLGSSGRVAYLWEVNGLTPYEVADRNAAGKKIERILDEPRVYRLDPRLPGSYSVMYDPTEFYEAIQPRFEWRQQWRALRKTLGACGRIILDSPWIVAFAAGWIFLPRASGTKLDGLNSVLIASGLILALYLAVYIEPRYLFPFLAQSLLLAYAPRFTAARLARAVTICFGAGTLLLLAYETVRYTRYELRRTDTPNYLVHQQAVRFLTQAGLKPGDHIGIIGYPQFAYLAHIGGWKIVTEAPTRLNGVEWDPSLEKVNHAVDAISATTARAIIFTEGMPTGLENAGWIRIRGTPFWARFLGPPAK